MYIRAECDAVCKEYNKMVKERSKRNTAIWSYIFLAYLLVMFVLPAIPNFLNRGEGWVIYIIYGGMAFVGISIALLISILTISDVPAFDFLYKQIYDKMNSEKGTLYNYESFEKGKFDFNKKGGIFSRFCRVEVKRHVNGTSPNGNIFDIFDVTLVTGGGKNKHEHFKGIYFITRYSSSTLFQVRSHSRPRRKDTKYTMNKEFKDVKVYIEEEKSMTNTEHKYIKMVERFKRNLKAKKIYLSITEDEIHFAYVPKEQIRKQYNLSIDRMNKLMAIFLEEIRVIDELVETSSF